MVVDPEDLLARDILTAFNPQSVCSSFYLTQTPIFSNTCVWNPPADAYETQDAFVVKIEIPGICTDNLTISFEDGMLYIRGCRSDHEHGTQTRLHHVEIRYGQFERAFTLPPHLDIEAIRADYREGFLIVSAPKRFNPPRTIQVDSE